MGDRAQGPTEDAGQHGGQHRRDRCGLTHRIALTRGISQRWIGERGGRTQSLLGSPGSYQQSSNFDYPFPDPYCDLATQFGDADGLQVRLRGYGPPETLKKLPMDVQTRLLMTHDDARGTGLRLPTANDGKIDTRATSGKPDYVGMSVTIDAGGLQNIIGVKQDIGPWATHHPGANKIEVAESLC